MRYICLLRQRNQDSPGKAVKRRSRLNLFCRSVITALLTYLSLSSSMSKYMNSLSRRELA